MSRNLATVSIGVALIFAPAIATAGPRDREEDLYGEWDLIGMVLRGVVWDQAGVKGGTIRIEKGKLFLRYKEFDKAVEYSFDVRPGEGAGEVDLTTKSGQHRGRYELNHGTLRVIWTSYANKPRPAGFDAEKDEGVVMYTLKRPKK
jgi:uncharacterized protein (TIGR03067 family)